MLNVQLQFDFKKVAQFLSAETRIELDKNLQWAVAELSKSILAGIRRELKASRIIGLIQSWRTGTPEGGNLKWSNAVWSNHFLSRLRDEGGTVTPGKSASRGGPHEGQLTKALTIPLPAAQTAISGVTRAGRVGLPSGVSQFGELKMRLFGKPGARIFGRLEKPDGTPMFLLARSVTIKGRNYMQAGVTEGEKDREKIMTEALRRTMEGNRATNARSS